MQVPPLPRISMNAKKPTHPSGISTSFMYNPHTLWKKYFWQESVLKCTKLTLQTLSHLHCMSLLFILDQS